MVLRLILVSIVAGLGATAPTENEVAGWSRTVQTWLDARLADWSVCLPLNEEALPPPPLAPADLGVVTLDDELLALYGEESALEAPAPSPEPKATADAGLATLNGLPATTMPNGHAEGGLPIGAQIIGGYLEDRTTIAFAGLIEREFGGFTIPPGYATL